MKKEIICQSNLHSVTLLTTILEYDLIRTDVANYYYVISVQ